MDHPPRSLREAMDSGNGPCSRFGLGFALPGPLLELPNPHTLHWGGGGCSWIFIDMDARMCITYVMNKMGEGTLGDLRGISVAAAAFGSLAAG